MQNKEHSADTSRERIRRRLINLVFLIYWFVIFEGALRKWVVPDLGSFIYFVEDPLILIAYFIAFKYQMWPKLNILSICGCILGLIYIILAGIQIVCLHANPLVTVYGMRLYFWYIPLAFVIGENFRGNDLARLIRETLLISIPVSVLVFVQFSSPPGAWVNSYVRADNQPIMVGEAVRTCGTFSYITGQGFFVGSTLPMLFLLWLIPPKQRPIGLLAGLVASISVLINMLLFGARVILFSLAITASTAVASSFLLAKSGRFLQVKYRLAAVPLICAIAAAILVFFFPIALEGQAGRLLGGEDPGGYLLTRVITPYTTMTIESIQSTPLLGRGLGVGSSGGAVIAIGTQDMLLNENEWPRIIEESGIAGLLYLAYRLLFAFALLVGAVQATRRSMNPLPLLLFSFAGTALAFGQLVIGGTPTYYGWMFTGFCLAANRLGLSASDSQLQMQSVQ